MIDYDANLMSALYATGTLDVPADLDGAGSDDPRMLSEWDIFDCEHQGSACDYITDRIDPELAPWVGMNSVTYCQVHTN